MKDNTLNFWKSFLNIFRKKKFVHTDNISPILNLLLTGDFRNLEIWETVDLFESVKESYLKEMQHQKETKLDELRKINSLLQREGFND